MFGCASTTIGFTRFHEVISFAITIAVIVYLDNNEIFAYFYYNINIRGLSHGVINNKPTVIKINRPFTESRWLSLRCAV